MNSQKPKIRMNSRRKKYFVMGVVNIVMTGLNGTMSIAIFGNYFLWMLF